MQKRHMYRGGFALPTVLIASVVMLTILAVSVSSVASVRTSLKTQYYEQLAKAAGEAGVAYAKACLAKNGNKPLWTDTKPLRPHTDCAGNSALADNPFRALVVAGGGSGGGSTGGGGGAGGVIQEDYFPLSTGSYPVVVGAGGAATGNQTIGRDGADSSFNSWIAQGGGGGGYSTPSAGGGGRPGGSGGGGQRYYGTYAPGAGTPGQGNSGGDIAGGGAGSTTGGGGAGGPGLSNPAANSGGNGGPGILSTITGASVYYAAGGGGGSTGGSCGGTTSGFGGIGGGGSSGEAGTAGQPNTGSGGGGGWAHSCGNGGAGGSGVVIISYPDNGSVTASGGTQVFTSGVDKVHVFKSNGTFSVSSVTNSSCPSDSRCSVMANGSLRSSFSVAKPAVDASGRALTIPNSGYVELLRATTGEVWRTYRQPAVQVAAVPDLCSGAASTMLGWQNAVVSASQQAIPSAGAAQSITLVDSTLAAGNMYFRKDFTVFEAGTYNLAVTSPASSDVVALYIDGTLRSTSAGSLTNTAVNLTAGCHTITAQLTNKTLTPKASKFTAAIQRSGSSPIVATDSSWRVSSGNSVHFSQPDYYADTSIWSPVTDYSGSPTAQVASSAWQTTQGDILTRFITPSGNGCASLCPAQQSGYMRDDEDFYVSSPTEVQVSTLCDDDCSVFLDGEMVIANSPWSAINQQTMTLTPGPHRLAVRIYNSPAATGPSGAAISVVNKVSGQVLARTDRSWIGSNVWTSGLNATTEDIRSYEASFIPSPDEIPRPVTFDYLVVAGGGGGGGNCNTCGGGGGGGGGGVISQKSVVATTGTRTITIGAGGAAGAGGASRTNGGNGGNTVFGTITAIGGGGGTAQLGAANAPSGGSGGGGSGGGSPGPSAGGAGTSGQGFAGGGGIPDPYGGGGGGGAGGAGVSAAGQVSGSGGAGYLTSITGSLLVLGGGGGGGAYTTNYAGASDVGAGDGVSQSINNGIGYSATANTGGGGGGANGNNRGGNGGAGGSGVVIIRVKTGTVTVSTTGSPVITTPTINGTPYTVYRFNASGSFTISAINS